MDYDQIWMKVKRMSRRERALLACEMRLRHFNVGYIHPHYYFDGRSIHDILFYAPNCQREIQDGDFGCYNALKEIVEDDSIVRVCFKRHALLPRFINDLRESRTVRKYICARMNEEYVNAWYRILHGESLAGERPRSLFVTLGDGSEVVYKLTNYRSAGKMDVMTFERTAGF